MHAADIGRTRQSQAQAALHLTVTSPVARRMGPTEIHLFEANYYIL